MADIKGLREKIKKYHERFDITEKSSEADRLRYRLTNGKKSKEEWLQLREDVRAFVESDAPEKEKEMLAGYTENMVMICSAIEDYGLELNDPPKMVHCSTIQNYRRIDI